MIAKMRGEQRHFGSNIIEIVGRGQEPGSCVGAEARAVDAGELQRSGGWVGVRDGINVLVQLRHAKHIIDQDLFSILPIVARRRDYSRIGVGDVCNRCQLLGPEDMRDAHPRMRLHLIRQSRHDGHG